MGVISNILESFIEQGKRLVKLVKFGENDNANAFLSSGFGDDFVIPEGYSGVYLSTSNSDEPVLIGVINEAAISSLNPGEKQIYSTNEAGDQVAAYIKLLNTGIIHFNGEADFIAGFNDLKGGFDELNQKHNDLVTAFNTHVHATAATGPPVPPTPGAGIPATPSTASIDSSKKENLKTE